MARRNALTRDRRLMAVFSVVAAMGLSTAGIHGVRAQMPAPEVVVADVQPLPDGRVVLGFLGDTMFGDGAAQLIRDKGVSAPLANVTTLPASSLTLANLEGPVTASDTKPVLKKYVYSSHPDSLQALRTIGVGAVSLNNNHSMDRGADGLADTRTAAEAAGVIAFGAGKTAGEAARPLIVRGGGQVMAVVALGEDFGATTRAASDKEGVVPFSAASVQRAVDMAEAAGAQRVIAMVHWGDNYQPVNDEQRQWARVLVDAGIDAIVGSGPHITQPIDVLDGVPIVWSMGNFVFGSPGRFESFSAAGYGLSVRLSWAADGAGRLEVTCLNTDNSKVGYMSRWCTEQESAVVLAPLNSALVLTGTTATMAF